MPNDVKSRVVLVIRQDGSMNVSSCRSSGSSEGRQNKMFDAHSVIGIRSDDGFVDGRIHWWDMAKNKVGVLMEECCL